MSFNNEKDIDSYISDFKTKTVAVFLAVCGSSWRATIRFFRYLPWRIKTFFKAKYKEYKSRPDRKDARKVYVLVGYTTRESVDAKYNAERNLIIIRRGLLALILLLLLFISIDRVINAANFGEISHMFGINSFEDITENDPFRMENNYTPSITPAVTAAETSVTAAP